VVFLGARGKWILTVCGQPMAYKSFSAKQYKVDGGSYEEAVEAALQAAIGRRYELIAEGVMKDKGERSKEEEHRSGVKGVVWNNAGKLWAASFSVGGKMLRKYFRPVNDSLHEVKRTRLLAEAARQAFEQEAGFAGTVVVHSKKGMPEELIHVDMNEKCIRWVALEGCFKVQVSVRSKIVHSSCRPATLASGDIEAARLRAIRVRDAIVLVRQQAHDDPELDMKDCQCQVGYYRIPPTCIQCTTGVPCPAGTQTPVGVAECTPCRPGRWSDAVGVAMCTPASPGHAVA